MKKLIFFIITLIVTQIVFGQSNDFYLGTSFSMQSEKRDFKFNSLHEKIAGSHETGSVLSYGIGIRIQKNLHKSWSLNAGINYLRREVWLDSPIWAPNLKPGYSETDHFGYNTIETQIGINKQLYEHKRWQIYGGLNFVMNSVIESNYEYFSGYQEFFNAANVNNGKSFNLVCGIGYNLKDRIRITAEPTLRIVHREKYSDPLMQEWPTPKFTYFNNFGLNVLLMYRIN